MRLFINGFGRIGRSVMRILLEDSSIDIVGINDIYDFSQIAYLLKYDSIYKELKESVVLQEDRLIVGKRVIKLFREKDPQNLDLSSLDIDILLQCSGVFLTEESNKIYIKNGAKRVIISAPANDDTKTYIYGVNHKEYRGEEIISNSSCSANAIVPIFDLLQNSFNIESAFLSMYHSYTAYQKLLDVKHYSKDIRRTRSATQNIIPLESSAAKATELFFPHLKTKLYAKSIRVPVAAVTFYDLSIKLSNIDSKESIIDLIDSITELKYRDILRATDKELVSQDFIKNPNSATIDKKLLSIQGDLLRIAAWQDNEYGYAKRVVDMAKVLYKSI